MEADTVGDECEICEFPNFKKFQFCPSCGYENLDWQPAGVYDGPEVTLDEDGIPMYEDPNQAVRADNEVKIQGSIQSASARIQIGGAAMAARDHQKFNEQAGPKFTGGVEGNNEDDLTGWKCVCGEWCDGIREVGDAVFVNTSCGGCNREKGDRSDKPNEIEKYDFKPSEPMTVMRSANPYKYQDLKNYRTHFLPLLEMEFSEERKQILIRLQTWPDKRLVSEGLCIKEMRGSKKGFFFGDPIVWLKMADDAGIVPNHKFHTGHSFVMSEFHPLKDSTVYEGTVIEKGPKFVAAVIKNVPNKLHMIRWRIDLGACIVTHNRMRDAVMLVTSDKFSASEAMRDMIVSSKPDPHKTEAGQVQNFSMNQRQTVTDLGDLMRLTTHLHNKTRMNSSQKKAIEQAASQHLTLIQGPPGTGKTTTAVQLIHSWIKVLKRKPVLVCAYTNVAVDNIMLVLLKAGINAIRVGSPQRVDSKLRTRTVMAQMKHHAGARNVALLLAEVDKIKKRAYKGSLKNRDQKKLVVKQQVNDCWSRVRNAEKQLARSICMDADVVCATCIGAGSKVLDGAMFELVIIDECCQSPEPATLIPISKCHGQVVILGDQKQLPPIVMNKEAGVNGLAMSMFDRLLDANFPYHMLDTQYRMHPTISAFPNLEFYDGKLKNGCKHMQRKQIEGFDPAWPRSDVNSAFVMVEGTELRSGSSWYNREECVEMQRLLQGFLDAGDVEANEIGIISPYVGQVEAMKELLLSTMGIHLVNLLEIKTVDGFQGREKELIIFSCVRSNRHGNVGFLGDHRRLNVAITRARRGLVILGNPVTLGSDPVWRRWMDYVSVMNKLGPQRAMQESLKIMAGEVSTFLDAGDKKDMPKVDMLPGADNILKLMAEGLTANKGLSKNPSGLPPVAESEACVEASESSSDEEYLEAFKGIDLTAVPDVEDDSDSTSSSSSDDPRARRRRMKAKKQKERERRQREAQTAALAEKNAEPKYVPPKLRKKKKDAMREQARTEAARAQLDYIPPHLRRGRKKPTQKRRSPPKAPVALGADVW